MSGTSVDIGCWFAMWSCVQCRVSCLSAVSVVCSLSVSFGFSLGVVGALLLCSCCSSGGGLRCGPSGCP
eukprot:11789950-Prorocentrum_lima.AAC.1